VIFQRAEPTPLRKEQRIDVIERHLLDFSEYSVSKERKR
jgi:hypothetical protein